MSKNVVAAAFVLSLTCLPAKADIINVAATGTVNGTDFTGVFGPSETVLLGEYSATYVIDTSFGAGDKFTNIYGGSGAGQTTTPVVFASLTINNHTAQFSAGYNGGLTTSPFGFYAYAEDVTQHNFLLTNLNIQLGPTYFPSSFLFDTSFSIDQTVSQGGQFQIYNIDARNVLTYAYGYFHTDTITITNIPQETVAVPGPIVGAGIPGLLALFGMGGFYWRRKQLAG